MKSLIYETPVESEEDMLVQAMAAQDVELPGIGDHVYQNMVLKQKWRGDRAALTKDWQLASSGLQMSVVKT